MNEAALQAEAGKLDLALALYQHALQLDEAVGDEAASAEDWLAYGQFLESAGFPARVVYACLVKSAREDALPDAAQQKLLADASKRIEKQIGSEAAAIRHDPQPTLREALALRR